MIAILALAALAYHSPRTRIYCKSQHETILADLNCYMAATCMVLVLTDDVAIKDMCIWPLPCRNKHKAYDSLTPLQRLLDFWITSQREKEAMKDERTHHGTMDKF